MFPPLLVRGGLAFVIDSSTLYALLVVSPVVLLAWAASANWVLGRRQLPVSDPITKLPATGLHWLMGRRGLGGGEHCGDEGGSRNGG
ncbi:hypothetical protein [Geodermatophilus sp. URMC 62]|uniref:hypothetical protein n=1 Tax=Geodermatophilus sp. URMC 62 TaxID=3423414 RepID=UPI00406D4F59